MYPSIRSQTQLASPILFCDQCPGLEHGVVDNLVHNSQTACFLVCLFWQHSNVTMPVLPVTHVKGFCSRAPSVLCLLHVCPRFYVLFHDNVKNSDTDGSDPAAKAAAVSGLLEKKIAAPLVRVQTALAKETVLWKRGILVMPKVQPRSHPHPTPPHPFLSPLMQPCARHCNGAIPSALLGSCKQILVTLAQAVLSFCVPCLCKYVSEFRTVCVICWYSHFPPALPVLVNKGMQQKTL